jgi:DksA/TraR C4-type zinc finger protein
MTCHAARRIPPLAERLCDSCTRLISAVRLRAMPAARLCAECEDAASARGTGPEPPPPCYAGLAGAAVEPRDS